MKTLADKLAMLRGEKTNKAEEEEKDSLYSLDFNLPIYKHKKVELKKDHFIYDAY